jgi:hypothetical protein
MTQADLQRQAERAAQVAVERLLDRSGCRISCALSGEVHQIYAGRFDLRPRADSGYCPNHPSTRKPCGLCPPGV